MKRFNSTMLLAFGILALALAPAKAALKALRCVSTFFSRRLTSFRLFSSPHWVITR